MLVFKPCCENFLLPHKIFTTTTINSKPHLYHHHHHDVKLHCSPPLKARFKSRLSASPPSDTLPPAAAVDFLMDSGGLSYVEAIQVIRKKPTLLLDQGSKPRSVIPYFESIGFSKTHHISKLILKFPNVLVADVEKTLKPKIQFFIDYGFTKSDLAELISSNPKILHASLENQIKPGFELLKKFVQTDEDLIKIIKRHGNYLPGFRKSIEASIAVLREHHGVQDSEILYLILKRIVTFISTPEVFKSIIERIVSLGFKPGTKMFLTAVSVMSGMKKPRWDSKINLLKGLGWSDEQIINAFRKYPYFLTLSRENLKESIEFFKKSLNWEHSSVLSQDPFILTLSLKKRVIPRYAVFKCLMSNEIIKEDTCFIYMLKSTETQFLLKYILNYQDQIPYLYEVYRKECMLGCKEEDNGEITNQQDIVDIDMTV